VRGSPALTAALQEAAAQAGQPPLFIAADQEGGQEEYSPAELDPSCIDETPSDLVSLIHFVIPNNPEISHGASCGL